LRDTFSGNEVRCFRAPFFGWSPPHLEALKKLGVTVDFSSSLSNRPVCFKGITLYPLPIPIDDGLEATFLYRGSRDIFPEPIITMLLRRKVTVFSMHPATLLVKNPFSGRDEYIVGGNVRTKLAACLLRLFFKRINFLRENNLIRVTASPSQNWDQLNPEEVDVPTLYQQSIQDTRRLFDHNPRFLLSHFVHFFGESRESKSTRLKGEPRKTC